MLVVEKIGRHLVLARRYLVVLGLGEDTQLPQFLVKILHEQLHADGVRQSSDRHSP